MIKALRKEGGDWLPICLPEDVTEYESMKSFIWETENTDTVIIEGEGEQAKYYCSDVATIEIYARKGKDATYIVDLLKKVYNEDPRLAAYRATYVPYNPPGGAKC